MRGFLESDVVLGFDKKRELVVLEVWDASKRELFFYVMLVVVCVLDSFHFAQGRSMRRQQA